MKNPTKEGYIIDFISGKEVRATPEETEAVQVFSRQLVDDYGYPIGHIPWNDASRIRKCVPMKKTYM